MHKILLVIQREYATRVRKPSFWILSIVVPLIVAGFYAIPIILASSSEPHINLLVADESEIFLHEFKSNKNITYIPAGGIEYAQRQLTDNDTIDAVLYIPARATTIPTDAFLYYNTNEPTVEAQHDIDNQIQNILRNNILYDTYHISPDDYATISSTTIRLHGMDINTGRNGFIEVKMAISIILAIIIMMSITLCSSQVMRGVAEEKTSRIVEVILCSVKPFQLMMGKVIGVALVGLTQFVLWLTLSAIGMISIRAANSDLFSLAQEQISITSVATKGTDATQQLDALQQQGLASEMMQGIASIDFSTILLVFLFFFVAGYLLYASLFAAVGALSDPDTSEQQYTLPITLPLILPLMLVANIVNEPSGALATWLSIIPFTSPIVMMMRLPFGVPLWQMATSMLLLLIATPLCTWLAARIYRTSILHYGKLTYSTLFRKMKQERSK